MQEAPTTRGTASPAMNGGETVFEDGVQATHGNRGTSALSSAALQAAITAMMTTLWLRWFALGGWGGEEGMGQAVECACARDLTAGVDELRVGEHPA